MVEVAVLSLVLLGLTSVFPETFALCGIVFCVLGFRADRNLMISGSVGFLIGTAISAVIVVWALYWLAFSGFLFMLAWASYGVKVLITQNIVGERQ